MSYFVTGATGFIGRRLVRELLTHHDADIFVLVRDGSRERFAALLRSWGSDRVVPITGDLTQPTLGLDPEWVSAHAAGITHFFHLAAIYDMAADQATNEALNVEGTRQALAAAKRLRVSCFHQVSSVAVAGDYRGVFDETRFAEGQPLPSPYHRTKYESERLVREAATIPWRIYRPAIVVGDSETGAMDKIDGPYYFFGMLKALRDLTPSWTPLVGVDLGDTNVVPVDYVAAAMRYLAHLPGQDGETFHLVNPEPQRSVDVVNSLCRAAGAPTFAIPVDRRLASAGLGWVPRRLRPSSLASAAIRSEAGKFLLSQTVGRLGVPAEVLAHTGFSAVFDSRRTEQALAGSGLSVPPLDSYAPKLWTYWEEHLDGSTGRDRAVRQALAGKHVVITGASSGIGLVTALKVAQAGGVPVLVARGKDKLEEIRTDIELRGGQAHLYPCDLTDLEAIDRLCKQLVADLPAIDILVNNAGRSIRRSLRLSHDRFHDFERTMQLNYFGAIRLIMGLMPAMQRQKSGHIVNISSIGVQTNPPRFSAYVASKSALDSWSNVVASEVVDSGITFTKIHMPLVRTPMIAPTKLYDKFPTISPARAADTVIKAMVQRPHEINTMLGNAGAIAHTVAPKAAFRVLNLAYHVFPDSAAAQGAPSQDGGGEAEQLMLARVFKGVHW